MQFMVRLLEQKKQKLLVKPWAGTMRHLRFLRKSMQITVQMWQSVVQQHTMLGNS